jgi:hypothetical protein
VVTIAVPQPFFTFIINAVAVKAAAVSVKAAAPSDAAMPSLYADVVAALLISAGLLLGGAFQQHYGFHEQITLDGKVL